MTLSDSRRRWTLLPFGFLLCGCGDSGPEREFFALPDARVTDEIFAVDQVLVRERVYNENGGLRVRWQQAFGDESTLEEIDDGVVTEAVAGRTAEVAVVFSRRIDEAELAVGNRPPEVRPDLLWIQCEGADRVASATTAQYFDAPGRHLDLPTTRGPTLVSQFRDGIPAESTCHIGFTGVTDEDGALPCARRGGAKRAECLADLSEVSFRTQPFVVDFGGIRDGDTGVPLDASLRLYSDIHLDPDSAGALSLATADGQAVALSLSYDRSFGELTGTPQEPLAPNTSHVVTVRAGEGGLRDAFGIELSEPVVLSFVTGP